MIDGDETSVRAGHVGDHLACDVRRFGGDGAGLSAGNGLAAGVGVPTGGDEECKVEESEYCQLAVLREKGQGRDLINNKMSTGVEEMKMKRGLQDDKSYRSAHRDDNTFVVCSTNILIHRSTSGEPPTLR